MSAVMQIPTINEDKMNTFLGKVGGDFGASLSSALVYIGQKLDCIKHWPTPVRRRQPSWPNVPILTNVTNYSRGLLGGQYC